VDYRPYLMSLDTKQEIWLTLAGEKFPKLTEDQLRALSLKAASEWYLGGDTELVDLFDQYVMLKTLKGIENESGNS
jgi:hypothetical protein